MIIEISPHPFAQWTSRPGGSLHKRCSSGAPVDEERMSKVDTTWLRTDSETNLMMILGVCVAKPSLNYDAMCQRIKDASAVIPTLWAACGARRHGGKLSHGAEFRYPSACGY